MKLTCDKYPHKVFIYSELLIIIFNFSGYY